MSEINNVRNIELYKKYRPRTWSEVIGQDDIVNGLKDDVSEGNLPTAYLFSGPKGTGKTTVARILAKAINCENPDGHGNPCNECRNCKSIDDGSCLGFHYLSAANINGVGDLREYLKQAKITSDVRIPIWILDEIQNLSPQAFDSLLIPLEDDKMPSLFIFCTTALSKVPGTVLTRVQQRTFSLVPKSAITDLLMEVLDKEGYSRVKDEDIPDGVPGTKSRMYSLGMITQAIRNSGATVEGGSVRGALSQMDRLLSSTNKIIDWSGRIAGPLFKNGNSAKSLVSLSSAIASGSDPRDILKNLVDSVRDMTLLLHKYTTASEIAELDEISLRRRAIAEGIGDGLLLESFRILGRAQVEMQNTDDTRVSLEMAIIDIGIRLRKHYASVSRKKTAEV